MPWLPAVAALVGMGTSIYSAVSAGGHTDTPGQVPPPVMPALPPPPTPEDAEAKAKAEIERQKRIRALSGGKTILASEGPILSSGAGKTLLGS